jgi:hypothetical protein
MGSSRQFTRGTDRAGKQSVGLFLKLAASRFPMLHAAHHVAPPEG